MSDAFQNNAPGLTSPGTRADPVTPNDSTDLSSVSRAIYVGVGGDIKVTTSGGSTVTLVGAVAGSTIPLRVSRVWSTGTTASDLVAFW